MGASRNSLKRFTEFWWGDRGFSALLFLLILILFLAPFFDSSLAKIVISVFLAFLMLTGATTTTDRKFLRVVAWVVTGIALFSTLLHHIMPSRAIDCVWYFSLMVFFFLLIGLLLKQVFKQGPVTGHRIRGAIAVYLLIGVTWTFIYELIALFIPGAFSFPPSMTALPGEPEHQSSLTYFSYVTMATLGYGDIVPVHPAARMLAILEALTGLLFPATLLARLVSLEIIYRNERTDQDVRDETGRGEDP